MDKGTFRWLTLFGIAGLLSAGVYVTTCADDTMNNPMESGREQPDYADVPYGPHERNTLDIWLAGNEAPTPLVVYFHGGGFRGSNKSSIKKRLLNSLLAAGISVAAVNYRLSSTAPYPAQMHDGARALQFLRHYAARYNIDPTRIGAAGVSAGGGISLWLAFHEDMADPVSKDPIARLSTRISTAVVYETQTTYDPRKIMELFNTTDVDEPLIPFFGMQTAADVNDPDYHPLFLDASPINHLTADDVPVMLYYSQADKPLKENSLGKEYIHHPRFGHLLKEKMDRLGIKCVLKLRKDYLYRFSNLNQDRVNFFLDVFDKKNHPHR
ncbi:MAG: alpha/beta hydrolase [Gammaproteobacteria bacterium]|nr:alpha/beta hydrolase [Gammaproteobacteria bacterium]